jgi:hypothetical protein
MTPRIRPIDIQTLISSKVPRLPACATAPLGVQGFTISEPAISYQSVDFPTNGDKLVLIKFGGGEIWRPK